MSDAASSPVLRTAPLTLWRVAEAFLQTLAALFGAPEQVAFRHTLTAQAHGQLALWLRCAEALMRRLIVIEASAFSKPNTRPLLHTRRLRARKLADFDAEHPEKWRVSFRVFVGDTHAGAFVGDTHARHAVGSAWRHAARACVSPTKVTFRSAWPLAERYEALLRVFNDPAPYARRLAQRLHATPHRLKEALRAPPEAAHRVECFAELSESAEHAWRPLRSSG